MRLGQPMKWVLRLAALSAFSIALFVVSQPTFAQNVTLDFGQGGQATGRIVQLIALLTVITLAPSILVMMTSFVRIVIVLSLLRVALGTQGTPPNTVIISLALFMTFFIMQPTLQQVWDRVLHRLFRKALPKNRLLNAV